MLLARLKVPAGSEFGGWSEHQAASHIVAVRKGLDWRSDKKVITWAYRASNTELMWSAIGAISVAAEIHDQGNTATGGLEARNLRHAEACLRTLWHRQQEEA